jgi:hypothetical protein
MRTDKNLTQADWIARGKAIVQSGRHAPARGEHLGRLYGVLDVYEGSPQPWKDALAHQEQQHGAQ